MNGQAATFRYHIDQPEFGSGLSRFVTIRGWCFATNGAAVRAIRLQVVNLTHNGVFGLPRPDVRAALPEAPNENTGFEIIGTLPSGRITLSIEAGLADGTWAVLMTRTVIVRQQFLPQWLRRRGLMELMFNQTATHSTHPPRGLRPERYPAVSRKVRQPRLAIVTPSFQHVQFLGETMRSIMEQTNIDVQYVVQDGGSTDGSKALIERFVEHGERRKEKGDQKSEPEASSLPPSSLLPAPRLVAWASAPDAGQADAIVKGFAKTTGGPDDLMAWINSDDFYLPGALAFVAEFFGRNPAVDVLYGHRIVVNEESKEIARWFLPKHDDEVLRLNDFVPQETMFWRRRIWDKVGGLDTSFKFAMDWDLLLRFQAAGARIVRVPYFLACFRVHQAQKTTALMKDVGEQEITLLRERTHGRPFPPRALENNPQIIRYLRRSAFVEFMWKLGVRLP